ncbi:hypothetical protein H2201_003852 [Coniosporium apollinis]|uniref:Uncharacterized protein n=2 Tax=Coniosporium TaxID=2810619 RepID=A0ABQ9NU85_9PEZI|nr:hypothetical protein H2199_002239 [Cladosporium sp. JES 115]KAJ9665941.1 hypothetical protein H2201_003852 [Coniosporium apollinis]
MVKVKSQRVSLPGEDPKRNPKLNETKRKAPPLSEEIVVESDDESHSGSSSGHSAGSESDPEKLRNTKTPRPENIKRTEPDSPPVPSDEDVSEGESGSEAEESDDKSQSQASSGAEEEENASGSGSASEGSGSKSESEVEAVRAEPVKPPARQEQTAHFRPPPPYEPPVGFAAAKPSAAPSSNIANLLNPKNLEGKQIWHITAPATVPITSIKEVALDKVFRGDTILEHNGKNYGFKADTEGEKRTTRVMMPGAKGYTPVPTGNLETLHLQQVVRLPHLSKKQADPMRGSDAAASYDTPAVKVIRQQPKGLRMRFRPSGFGDEDPGSIGSSESEDSPVEEQSQIGFRAPRGREAPAAFSPSKKRKHDAVNGDGGTPQKSAKKKKRTAEETIRTEESHFEDQTRHAREEAIPGTPPTDGPVRAKAGKEKSKKARHAEGAGPEGSGEEKEKKKRKKEKHKDVADGINGVGSPVKGLS